MVVLDTNALFLPVRRNFPLEAEIQRQIPGARLVLPSAARDELDRLELAGTRGARAARQFADRFPVERTDRAGDEGVVEVAIRLRATVITADRELQRRLAEAGIPVLVPRDRHRLELRDGKRRPDERRRGNS